MITCQDLGLYQPPELDIVCYFPVTQPRSLSAIDRASAATLAYGMKEGDRSVYLSTLRVTANAIGRRHDGIVAGRDGARILRSVLMKPEAEGHVRELHSRVERLVADPAA